MIREGWHCGFLPEATWRPIELPPFMGAPGQLVNLHEIGICPGWLTRQPAVIECVQASLALKSGELSTFFPGLEATVLEGALLSQQAFNLYDIFRMKEAAQGHQ